MKWQPLRSSRCSPEAKLGTDRPVNFLSGHIDAGYEFSEVRPPGRAYYNTEGKPFKLASVGIDITERKEAEKEILRLNGELERRVRERTMQLEIINKELEAFSYSVSHDLRAPLRSIRGFSEVLLERYADKLDERGQEFLRRACESSEHMDLLIENLLQLSRVTRAGLKRQTVNLSGLAESICAD